MLTRTASAPTNRSDMATVLMVLLLGLVFPVDGWKVSDYVGIKDWTTCGLEWRKYHDRLRVDLNCSKPDQARILGPANSTEAFYISENNTCMTALPVNICDFPGLIDLTLRYSNISEIPPLNCLSNLAYLDLRGNKITRLRADTFAGLGNLIMLILINNNIQKIDVGVFNPSLVNLVNVFLDHNKLTACEAWPMLLEHRFCYFSVSNNKISKFTNKENWTLTNKVMESHGMVDFSNNNFSEWFGEAFKDYGIESLPALSKFMSWGFDFRGNPWHCDCRFHELLKLTHGSFVEVWFRNYMMVTCASPPHLAGHLIYDLPLSELVCNVSEACPDGCLCQDQPHQARMLVDCRGKGLQALPSTLPPGTLHLHLQNNFIRHLPPAPYLARVQELLLAHNHLVSISGQAVELLGGARLLDVSHNRLHYLPRQLQHFPPGALRVEQNPLQCRCNSSWLGQWLRDMQDAYGQTLVNLTCQLEDGRSVPVIEVTVKSLGCEEARHHVVVDVVLGCSLLLLLLVLVLALLFRYELLFLLHSRRMSSGRPEGAYTHLEHDWFLSVESEDEPDRLWAGQELKPALDSVKGLKLYIPFIHHSFGGVAVDQTMAAIQQSRGAIVLLSRSYASSRPRSFEFSHLYKVMAIKGQGPIWVIKHRDVKASSVVNGYLRAMVRLKKYVDFEDEALVSKIAHGRESA